MGIIGPAGSSAIVTVKVRPTVEGTIENHVLACPASASHLAFENREQTTIVAAPPAPNADSDGVTNSEDNCPNAVNPNQEGVDEDGIGDVCDPIDDRESPPAEQPTSKDDCKNGGHARFGFENQGQCIRAVEQSNTTKEPGSSSLGPPSERR